MPQTHPAPPLDVDVLIVGGGLVGGTLAAALAQDGVSTALIDTEDPATLTAPAHDGRASAIALAGQKVFAGTGIWPHMAGHTQPIEDIRVSDGPSLLFLHYDHRQIGTEPLGHMAENRIIREAIHARLKELEAAGKPLAWLAPARVAEIRREAGGARARLDDGRTLTARLVVAADGRGSPTRTAAGIGVRKYDYHQTGIVLTIGHEKPHQGCAFEHFLPAGPFAVLPLPDDPTEGHRSSLVWTERSRLAPAILKLPDDAFQAELESRIGDFLGAVRPLGPRFGYPLSLQHAAAYHARRLVLVGDAAHGMHPIAGQGMNMGLRDIAALAQVVVDSHRLGLDVGGAQVITDYVRWRRFDNMLMLAVTDGLNRLFSNDMALLRTARDLGMAAVDKWPDLKRLFMRHAMGQTGTLPRLMRG